MGWIRDAVVVDFETLPIEQRPAYPPKPVGVAIREPGRKSHYLAWGHVAGGNNSRLADARRELGRIWGSGRPLIFHNAKFDLEVASKHMGLPIPDWQRIHDTGPMMFLLDPRAPDYKLKSSSERLLDMPPEERDAVVDWLIEHQPVDGVMLSRSAGSKNYAGAYIAYSPGDLAGKYAIGDVDRTYLLAEHCWPQLESRSMVAAYELEMELIPHILTMEKQGLRIDVRRLERDVKKYSKAFDDLETWVGKTLKIKDLEAFNFNSSQQLAKALIDARLCDPKDLGVTPTGKMQTNKEALSHAVKNKAVLSCLKYRAQLKTCLSTFMRPWLETASNSGGYIYTTWNSTRVDRGDDTAGTRTGRLSSTPNFQNMAKLFKELFGDGTKLPRMPIELPPLPMVRSYVVAYENGHKLFGRDFSGQENRVLAHYEDDQICAAYHKDPKLDMHQMVADQLEAAGYPVGRQKAKVIDFAIMYGVGLGHLAEMLDTDTTETKKIREAYFKTFPSIKQLMSDISHRWRHGGAIRTLIGREYFVEPPKVVNGRLRDFSYKGMNLVIQGSSADLTKMAMLQFAKTKPRDTRMLISVHDEIVASAPSGSWEYSMALLRACMDAPRLDVPLMSDGYYCSDWAHKHKCD